MKRLLLSVLLASFCISFASAQDSVKVKTDGKNLIKLNLTALPLNTFSGVYERAVSKKTAVGLGFRYMAKGEVPFLDKIKDAIDDPETNDHLSSLRLGNYAITPEVKFYLGKSVFRGFYIAPFGRYSVYSADLPFNFTVDEGGPNESKETIPLAGNITTITGGLLFGAQWKLSRMVYLDWFILGPNAGSAKGDITGTKTLTDEERDALQDAINDLKDSDIPLVKVDGEATNNGAKVSFSGPWAGLRAGISIGIRF